MTAPVLITSPDSYLGENLAISFLDLNYEVYALSKKAPKQLLANRHFTLVDIDLAQPFPDYLPTFALSFHYPKECLTEANNSFEFSPQTKNMIAGAQTGRTKLCLLMPIEQSDKWSQKIPETKNIKPILIGDIYGPGDLSEDENLLSNLIAQATKTDRIVLENEGRDFVYPTYVTDAVFALNKFAHDDPFKKTRVIVSQEPITALAAAYEIQAQAGFILNKQVNLFFSGHPKEQDFKVAAEISLKNLGFEPHFDLEEGLKKIFNQIKEQAIHTHRASNFDKAKKEHEVMGKVASEIAKKKKRLNILANPKKILPGAKKLRSKKTAFIVLALILLFVAKAAIDLFFGLKNLNAAQLALNGVNLESAHESAAMSHKDLSRALAKIRILTLPAKPLLGGEAEAINQTVEAASLTALSLSEFSQAAQSLIKNVEAISTSGTRQSFELSNAGFQKAYFTSSQALQMAENAKAGGVFQANLTMLQDALQKLSRASSSAYEASNLLPMIVAPEGRKTYLAVVQDNTEIRPGGGLIEAYGKIEFENGRLKNITFEDIAKANGQLSQRPVPPRQLTERLGIRQLTLRDSSTSPNFETSSSQILDLFEAETGLSLDAVVAFDLNFLQKMLEITGPIKLGAGEDTVTAQNLHEASLKNKGEVLALLCSKITGLLITNLSRSESANLVAMTKLISDSLSQKHLLVSAKDENLASFIKTKTWNNPLPPVDFDPADDRAETRDFLSISEANLGANKANQFIERKIEYKVGVSEEAKLSSELKITYTNNSKSRTWPEGPYVNFLELHVPFGSTVSDYQEDGVSRPRNVTTLSASSLTTFSTYVEVAPASTKTVVFKYETDKGIQLEKAPAYRLYVQKQPGTSADPFLFKINLPPTIKIESVNLDKKLNAIDEFQMEAKLEKDLIVQLGLSK